MGSRWMRNSFVYLMILVAVIAIVVIFFRPGAEESDKKDLSQVINDAKTESIQKIEVSGNTLSVTKDDGSEYTARKEDNSSLVEILTTNGVDPLPPIEV